MSYQREGRDQSITLIITGERGVRLKYNRYCPYYTYPCQKMCTCGIQFITIPSLNESVIASGKNMQLWKLSSLLTQVQCVWQIFADAMTKMMIGTVGYSNFQQRTDSTKREGRIKKILSNTIKYL